MIKINQFFIEIALFSIIFPLKYQKLTSSFIHNPILSSESKLLSTIIIVGIQIINDSIGDAYLPKLSTDWRVFDKTKGLLQQRNFPEQLFKQLLIVNPPR